MITLRNQQMSVEISEHGAELQSIVRQRDGRELLWQGDAQYWGRRSPILFPIVGRLWNGVCRIDGKAYEMKHHGFARDMDFSIVDQCEESVTLRLTDTPETLKMYPFRFRLDITYTLKDNRLGVNWTVENTDRREMFFQIGGHPAFKLSRPAEGVVRMNAGEHPLIQAITPSGFVAPKELEADFLSGEWHFKEEDFRDDAIVLGRSQTNVIELADCDDCELVKMEFQHPCVALWTPYGKHAPFLCIEPWYGIADEEGFEGEFRDKLLTNRLLPGAAWHAAYSIDV